MGHTKKARLTEAAFELFATQGFDNTSVDDIAAQSGVARSTFFRYFPTKEDVVFPDHDVLIPQVEARLATATPDTWRGALREATRMVLTYYVAEGDVARTRYQLTRTVPALRDREVATVHRYQRLFTRYISTWTHDGASPSLRSEFLASNVIAAHNHVLRSWLTGTAAETDPNLAFDAAMDQAFASVNDTSDAGHTIVIHTRGTDIARTIESVRQALSDPASD